MAGDRRPVWTGDSIAGRIEAAAIAATLGRDARAARRRRRVTQAELARRIGISPARLSQIERGQGANAPLGLWIKLGIAVGRPVATKLSRDIDEPEEPRDAGHLAAQELILRLARRHGRAADVELATKPWDPSHAADVVLRDRRQRVLLVIEILNRAGDLGASLRASDRKAAELGRRAVLAGGDGQAYRVAVGWLLVDSAANRALVRRFPELHRSRFPGSSARLAQCLTAGAAPDGNPAVAWVDPRRAKVSELRLRT